MTFGTLLPPVNLTTGLHVHGLVGLLAGLDTDSAGSLARHLLQGLEVLVVEQRTVLCIQLVHTYMDRLIQACAAVVEQCPQSVLDPEHRETIDMMAKGLLWRVRVRIWFLRTDALLAEAMRHGHRG